MSKLITHLVMPLVGAAMIAVISYNAGTKSKGFDLRLEVQSEAILNSEIDMLHAMWEPAPHVKIKYFALCDAHKGVKSHRKRAGYLLEIHCVDGENFKGPEYEGHGLQASAND